MARKKNKEPRPKAKGPGKRAKETCGEQRPKR